MKEARRRQGRLGLLWIVSGVLAVGGVVACSGPQPLSLAMQPQDAAEFDALCAASSGTVRDAFLRAAASARGISIDEAAARDAALSEEENPFSARHDQSAVSRGAAIYRHECASCHGVDADGRGPAMPVVASGLNFHRTGLRMDITFHGGPEAKWFHTISEGGSVQEKAGDGSPVTLVMPPFKDRLAKEQIWLAVTYLQSLDADAPSPSRGAK